MQHKLQKWKQWHCDAYGQCLIGSLIQVQIRVYSEALRQKQSLACDKTKKGVYGMTHMHARIIGMRRLREEHILIYTNKTATTSCIVKSMCMC